MEALKRGARSCTPTVFTASSHSVAFYVLSTYGVCKERNYCKHEKKNSPLDRKTCLVCPRIRNRQKMSVSLNVPSVDTITFKSFELLIWILDLKL